MRRIADEVDRELRRFGPVAGMTDVVSAWPSAVGEAIARNAWPARLARDGTLHVSTSSSAWAFELAQLAPTVLGRLRASLGDRAPEAIRFAPGRLPELGSPPPSPGRTAPAAVTDVDRERAAELVAPIDNEELRALVARAAAASLASTAADRSL